MAVFTANKDVYEAPNHVPEAEQICIVFSVHWNCLSVPGDARRSLQTLGPETANCTVHKLSFSF